MHQHAPHTWSAFLSDELGCDVRVRFGSARRRVLHMTPALRNGDAPRAKTVHVRMSRLLADAPHDVRRAVAAWMRGGEEAMPARRVLQSWIAAAASGFPEPSARATPLRPGGRHHDLAALARALTRTELSDGPPAGRWPDVTWGPRGTRKVRHSIQLGSFVADSNLIRVHPVLDQVGVPDWFVRYILFHEMLHALLPPKRSKSGRVQHHHREFRSRESRYPDYERALRWQDDNIGALIRSLRTGRPIAAHRARTASPDRAPAPTNSKEPDRSSARPRQGLLFDGLEQD